MGRYFAVADPGLPKPPHLLLRPQLEARLLGEPVPAEAGEVELGELRKVPPEEGGLGLEEHEVMFPLCRFLATAKLARLPQSKQKTNSKEDVFTPTWHDGMM